MNLLSVRYLCHGAFTPIDAAEQRYLFEYRRFFLIL